MSVDRLRKEINEIQLPEKIKLIAINLISHFEVLGVDLSKWEISKNLDENVLYLLQEDMCKEYFFHCISIRETEIWMQLESSGYNCELIIDDVPNFQKEQELLRDYHPITMMMEFIEKYKEYLQ